MSGKKLSGRPSYLGARGKMFVSSNHLAEKLDGKKTWIEIDGRAAQKNCAAFRKIIGPRVKLWAVVKSNAYGHGLLAFSKAVDGSVDGFCVDSVVEGIKLRRAGIKKFILVLGPTLPALFSDACAHGVTVSISNFDVLKSLASAKNRPAFHLKIDTGMHRQGFYPEDTSRILKFLKSAPRDLRNFLVGACTHFASAKDVNYPTYTEQQFKKFQDSLRMLKGVRGKQFFTHSAATGGALLGPRYHGDAVRVGIGLYGYYPSRELEIQSGIGTRLALRPVLAWKAIISEIKNLKPGDYVGYDLAERVLRHTKMAILPVGYWHGMPRSVSGKGRVWISGRLGKILGRVSMDLLAVDVTGIPCRVGDSAMLVGPERGVLADEVGECAGTTHYEILTRLNPLIERWVIS